MKLRYDGGGWATPADAGDRHRTGSQQQQNQTASSHQTGRSDFSVHLAIAEREPKDLFRLCPSLSFFVFLTPNFRREKVMTIFFVIELKDSENVEKNREFWCWTSRL